MIELISTVQDAMRVRLLQQILQLKSLETPAKSKHPPVYANMKIYKVGMSIFWNF